MADEFTKAALYWIKTFNKKVKEKIWMEKLINLLNEFEIEREEKIDLFNDKEKPLWEWYKDCTGDLTFEPTDSKNLNWEAFSWDAGHSVIISKSYGFIWWLVENDKIDYKKLKEGREDLCNVNTRHLRNKYIDVASLSYIKLLMLLSISDTPIEDLISYLR